MNLSDCNIKTIEQQKEDLINLSSDEWKQTEFYKERLDYINGLLKAKRKLNVMFSQPIQDPPEITPARYIRS